MGWWGYGPMEGDPPLDMSDMIDDACSQGLASDEGVRAALAVRAKMERTMGWLAEPGLFMQVLGIKVMSAGGPLSLIKDEVLKAIEQDDASYFSEPKERIAVMAQFRAIVESYVDGSPTKVPNKGLLEAIREKEKRQ